ncbi:STM4012 family radical SAM protein [Tahibacter amnicola]|uniref:STM4012 family radical SAM protein n=1 Tax=Tahibacter amnicola TaxID=2976241 RepID=A0ABY6BHG0_9GAMM|nr:STM4012 family radical SAM protein [Tahibacter amnicola]UXI69458.1 STM4012 family radical SAM protein [Tahibacter amnicola]
MTDLLERLAASPFEAYAYSYPHKTAYRALAEAVPLAGAWQAEDRSRLFAYFHIPFCTYRCGFCNLFAIGQPGDDLVDRYLDQMQRQMTIVAGQLGDHRIAQVVLGGGTPSYLTAAQLATLFEVIGRRFTVDLGKAPVGMEVSPETATHDRLSVCRSAGVDRISMGVQSFSESELSALVRPASVRAVLDAVDVIRRLDFPTLNLDLIYGIPGQTPASFVQSLRQLLALQPEEIYLYPLYVRPQTGMDRLARQPADAARRQLYEVGRDHLLASGYHQVSMRLFRTTPLTAAPATAYRCQDDGMVGIGCGARSYTRALHYSDDYAVARSGIHAILRRYVELAPEAFAQARHGFVLNDEEQRRRYLIQSLLTWPGLGIADYATRFGETPQHDFPEIDALQAAGLARADAAHIALTPEGMAYADAIGPWLNSAPVQQRMAEYAHAV